MIVKVSDKTTGMTVTYWHVKPEDAEVIRAKAKKELEHRKDQLSGTPVIGT